MEKTQLSDDQIKYLDAHYGRITREDLADRLGITLGTLKRRAAERGLTNQKYSNYKEIEAAPVTRSWNATCADLRRRLGLKKGVRA